MRDYLVGGAVRDMYMGLRPKDRDWVVVGATREKMLERGFQEVGARFKIYVDKTTGDEYALATSITTYDPDTYNKWSIIESPNVDLADDLARRDITINAMAWDHENGYIDPFNGRADIDNKIIRMVSVDNIQFDPLRIVRIARFAARYADFTIDPKTVEVCRSIAETTGIKVPKERIWKEISRGLMENKPSRMFEVLRQLGASRFICPELDALAGVQQNPKHHPEVDTYVHVMMVIDYAAKCGYDLETRYACLCHDFGKALTPANILPAHHGHELAGVTPTKEFSERIGAPEAFIRYAEIVCREHLKIHTITQHRDKTITDLLTVMDIRRNPRVIDVVANACLCDARGRLGKEDAAYSQAGYFRRLAASYLNTDISEVVKNSKPQRIMEDIRRARIAGVCAELYTIRQEIEKSKEVANE